MRRIPLTLRALVLVPLLAALADHARTAVCSPGAETCLQAAGGGPSAAVMIGYALALALLVGRLARGGWPEMLAFCALAGGVIAFALRAVPALVRRLRPSAPRPPAGALVTLAFA